MAHLQMATCGATTKAGKPCRRNTGGDVCHLHADNNDSGVVYVLTNETMPGLVKIGWTRGCANKRAVALSAPTGVAVPFKVAYTSDKVVGAHAVEIAVHQALNGCRLQDNREFFRCTATYARAAIEEQLPAPLAGVHTVTVPEGTTELRILFGTLSVD